MKLVGKFDDKKIVFKPGTPAEQPNQEFKEIWDGDDDFGEPVPVETFYELREDGSLELREGGDIELRQ